MNSRIHKSVFRRWRDQNERTGSRTGISILDFLANEPEPNPLMDNFNPIPRVPMHPDHKDRQNEKS